MKPLFQQGPSLAARVLLLAVLSLALMFLDHRRQLAQPVRDALALSAYPIQAVVNLPFELNDLVGENLRSRRQLIEENARLQSQQLLYEARLLRLDALERENIALRELLQSSYSVTESVLIAGLMRVDLDPATHLIQINKGTRSGVYVGQPVLDAGGVMGQVDEVAPLSAIVRLITDPSHAIPVRVNRNGIRAIAHGTGDTSRLELVNVPNNADITADDLLVTSGLGGRFPSGYPVGRVISVDLEPGQPFARISVAPTAALDRSRQVLLVRSSDNRPPAEQTDSTEAAGEKQ
ncbi:MAG TPA: rod shape-determining protein MreC [Gammaproteobacteria bacterium]|nr:rod shape-determining protein MreC [Gammaproteobacteria bacterium]